LVVTLIQRLLILKYYETTKYIKQAILREKQLKGWSGKKKEAEDLVSKFMQNRKICCFEITEVNPTLDKENLMAEIAFNILQRSVNVLMMN
jgi:predicted CoA-binding protein